MSRRSALAGALASVSSPAWSALISTPRQTPGPFYPTRKPDDSDADLVMVAGRSEPAQGVMTLISGQVLDPSGRPIDGARIEIWQCDAFGVYHHPAGGGGRDANFQGYGRTETATDGAYRFRTIRPVPYPGRAPHIHFAVQAAGLPPLTTQMYVAGEQANDGDFVLNSVRDPVQRTRLIVALAPTMPRQDDRAVDDLGAALAGRFDIILAEA